MYPFHQIWQLREGQIRHTNAQLQCADSLRMSIQCLSLPCLTNIQSRVYSVAFLCTCCIHTYIITIWITIYNIALDRWLAGNECVLTMKRSTRFQRQHQNKKQFIMFGNLLKCYYVGYIGLKKYLIKLTITILLKMQLVGKL